MKDAKLQIHLEKIIFHIQKIYFFKYITTDKRMKIDFKKIKAILEWPIPILAKKILLFLEFAEFE